MAHGDLRHHSGCGCIRAVCADDDDDRRLYSVWMKTLAGQWL